MDNKSRIKKIFEDSLKTKKDFIEDDLNTDKVDEAANALIECYDRGGKVIVFGNGGSAADSQHMAAELLVRFEKERKSLPCIALSTNSSTLTATSNDYSFDKTFSRQVEGLAEKNDVVVAISTSGNSSNVLEGVKAAKEKKVPVIALTGKDGGKLAGLADVPIVVKSDNTARIQEAHITIIHALCKIVEEAVC
ncbi:MAG: D-sedoheptulose 7-phosphate isomerase [Candidatus Omnitrophota bacterium]|jgi:D-sedoheptulose 7-phosphate isomerase